MAQDSETKRLSVQHHDTFPQSQEQHALTPWLTPFPGLSLTVICAEITLGKDEAYLKAERHQMENGRVTTERMEGHVPPAMYHEAWQMAARQAEMIGECMYQQMRLFMPWLPNSRR
ncbi:hypothetical protein GCM10007160_29370 [Litchfieldella qijiaojingensis]|uniref:Uncharacterized protein n=1 Tax=Litchfieldella qijiaojingensis TaxID=980347 RepID=A0ABQ2Z1J9_9GAMM|nr:hypothetical protein [Halomonas qijiaojingensis]GGX99909.1 hypothetical protein GCM10007160_29370 [Halomonas qijiaojingensis]